MSSDNITEPAPGSPDGTGRAVPGLLQDMVMESPDVEGFLSDLASLAADHFTGTGRQVFCGVTLLRPRKAHTVASSSAQALKMDEVQYAFGDGPCLTAARTNEAVYVPDIHHEPRWSEYLAAIAGHGIGSILGVPIPLDGDAACGLNLYSTVPSGFDDTARDAAGVFAREASQSLRLAVRIANLTDTGENLKAAMDSRTTIDLAAGIIMGQNRCSQDTAMTILKAASSARNTKLRDVAAAVVASTGHSAPAAHFQN
jgi:putative methionine-R-sulfoxide reductase with GAF domain